MAVIRELVTRFGFSVDSAGINRVESSIDRLSGMLQGLAAFASLRALAGVADSMQSLEARIGMLPQTIGDVGEAFNEVSKNATANRQSLVAYGAFYTKVGQAAKNLITEQGDLLKVTNTISQALVVGGATTAEAQSAMLQFGQALGSGVLQGEEFRAMAESAPQYLDALAESMGYPREQLKKMASDGKLTSKAVIEATLKMSTIFEEKFRQMPMTIGQATTIIGNRFSTMVQNMNRESQVVTTVANFLLDGFAMVERGAQRFIDFVGGNTNALKTLGIALAALLGPMALAGLVSVLGAVFSIGGLVVGGLILLGLAIEDLITWANGGESSFGDFLDSMETDPITGILMAVLGFVGALRLLSSGLLLTIGRFAMLGVSALFNGARIGAGMLLAMGPIGLLIGAFAALAGGIYLVGQNWDKIKGFFMNLVGISPSTPNVGAGAVAGASAGGGTTVDARQTVNLTVPAGTPESQQAFLKNAAAAAMGEGMEKKIARDMAMAGGF